MIEQPNQSEEQRIARIIHASWIGIIFNALLAISKIIFGLIDNSFAVISDGVDSGIDILTSVITLFAARLMLRPPDKTFPFGYGRVDPLATKVLSLFIFFAGLQLIFAAGSNLVNLIRGASSQAPLLPSTPAMVVTGISIVVKFLLARYISTWGKNWEAACSWPTVLI